MQKLMIEILDKSKSAINKKLSIGSWSIQIEITDAHMKIQCNSSKFKYKLFTQQNYIPNTFIHFCDSFIQFAQLLENSDSLTINEDNLQIDCIIGRLKKKLKLPLKRRQLTLQEENKYLLEVNKCLQDQNKRLLIQYEDCMQVLLNQRKTLQQLYEKNALLESKLQRSKLKKTLIKDSIKSSEKKLQLYKKDKQVIKKSLRSSHSQQQVDYGSNGNLVYFGRRCNKSKKPVRLDSIKSLLNQGQKRDLNQSDSIQDLSLLIDGLSREKYQQKIYQKSKSRICNNDNFGKCLICDGYDKMV